MNYIKKINIYEIRDNISIPLMSNPNEIADCSIGDMIIVIDDNVWVRDWNNNRVEQHALANISESFIIMNSNIFNKLT